MAADDLSLAEVAQRLGKSPRWLQARLAADRQRHPAQRRKLAADRLRVVVALRGQGLSLADIAQRVALSKTRVIQILAEAGVNGQKTVSTDRKLTGAGKAVE